MELAKDKIGRVLICKGGNIVHVNFKGMNLHFFQEAFLNFYTMIEESSSKLIDMNTNAI